MACLDTSPVAACGWQTSQMLKVITTNIHSAGQSVRESLGPRPPPLPVLLAQQEETKEV